MRFDEILTNDDLLDALYDMHFDECTPIQEMSIPPVIDGRDLLAVPLPPLTAPFPTSP